MALIIMYENTYKYRYDLSLKFDQIIEVLKASKKSPRHVYRFNRPAQSLEDAFYVIERITPQYMFL